jgi:hypothetical protein
MSGADRRTAHLAAMAILVADEVLDPRTAIEALMEHEDRHQGRQQRGKEAPGEQTARSLARMVDKNHITYAEAEHTVAMILTGGTYDRFEAAEQHAGRLLAHALTRRDERRGDTAQALRQAIATQPAPAREATQAPAASAPVSSPSQRPRPVLRQPGR